MLLTLRGSTERPETGDVGSNILVGTDPNIILKSAKAIVVRRRNWISSFGDGKTSKKIIDILKNSYV
jgi:UDP-N-acetylglucosamine 2-epimerase (non-hydrolysing)